MEGKYLWICRTSCEVNFNCRIKTATRRPGPGRQALRWVRPSGSEIVALRLINRMRKKDAQEIFMNIPEKKYYFSFAEPSVPEPDFAAIVELPRRLTNRRTCAIIFACGFSERHVLARTSLVHAPRQRALALHRAQHFKFVRLFMSEQSERDDVEPRDDAERDADARPSAPK